MKKYLKTFGLVLYILIVAIFSGRLFFKLYVNDKLQNIETKIDMILTGTNDISVVTGVSFTGLNQFSGIEVAISEIDQVNSILLNGKPGEDFSVIIPKPQIIKYSDNVKEDFNNYLAQNTYSLIMPSNISGGYLYIKLKKELKFMSKINVYQTITLQTNIYSNGWGVYGRLDTEKTLPVNLENQEFLYDLNNIPIKTAKHNYTNWLSMKGKKIIIGGFVSDTQGNYIEKIVFIRKK